MEALKKLIINQSIGSFEKSPSSSIFSGSELSCNPITLLIQQLKAKFFEVYLCKTIKENPFIISDIKDFLKKLNGQDLPDPTVDFVMEFEPFLSQITQNRKRKKEDVSKLRQKNDVIS